MLAEDRIIRSIVLMDSPSLLKQHPHLQQDAAISEHQLHEGRTVAPYVVKVFICVLKLLLYLLDGHDEQP